MKQLQKKNERAAGNYFDKELSSFSSLYFERNLGAFRNHELNLCRTK
jgi:hypothetical protein